MTSLGDRVRRIASDSCDLDDLQFQANMFKKQITLFILKNASRKERYCVLNYEASPPSEYESSECHVPVQRNVMTHIIRWLKDEEKLRVFDQENDSYVLIGLR